MWCAKGVSKLSCLEGCHPSNTSDYVNKAVAIYAGGVGV